MGTLPNGIGEPNGPAPVHNANGGIESTPASAPMATVNARIRECRPDDLVVVAALFSRILRGGEKCNLAMLESYLRNLFFEHPWRDPELTSRVTIAADGRVNGFVGILPLRMTHRGTEIRAALATALMVERQEQDPTAGARLLRSVLTGAQDLSLSEYSNPLVRRMWQRLGGIAVPTCSMDWVRILRPVEYRIAQKASGWLASWIRPIGIAFEALLGTSTWRRFRLEQNDARITRADPASDELIDLIQRFSASYELKPAWDAANLRWFFTHAARKELDGELTSRVVYGKNRTPLGCYLYYGRPGGIAFVLQIFSARENSDTVVKSLLADVNDLGCAAVWGRSQPDFLDALLQNGCTFRQGSSFMMHSRNADLLATIRAGDALVTGLAGESWTRLIRGRFD